MTVLLSDYVYGAKYTIKIPEGKLATAGGISLSEEYILNFEVEIDEDILRTKLEELSNKETVSADDSVLLAQIKSLVKKLSAQGTDVTQIANYDCYEKLLSDVVEVNSAAAKYSNADITIDVKLDTKIPSEKVNATSIQLLRRNKQVDYTIETHGDEIDSFLIKLDNTMKNEQNIRLNVNLGYICKYSDFFDIPDDFSRSQIML